MNVLKKKKSSSTDYPLLKIKQKSPTLPEKHTEYITPHSMQSQRPEFNTSHSNASDWNEMHMKKCLPVQCNAYGYKAAREETLPRSLSVDTFKGCGFTCARETVKEKKSSRSLIKRDECVTLTSLRFVVQNNHNLGRKIKKKEKGRKDITARTWDVFIPKG